jgi:hypothetical protein
MKAKLLTMKFLTKYSMNASFLQAYQGNEMVQDTRVRIGEISLLSMPPSN